MIALTKDAHAHPAITQLAQLEAEFHTAYDTNDYEYDRFLKGYSKPSIKDVLIVETSKKCAYCESRYRHVDWGDVEHIEPKSHDLRNRLLSYDNLTIACAICNVRKSDYESAADPLINPYRVDPRLHLQAMGPVMLQAPQSRMGYIAITILDLNRDELVLERTQFMKQLVAKHNEYNNEANPALKTKFGEQIQQLQNSDQPFSRMCRDYVRARLPHLSIERD